MNINATLFGQMITFGIFVWFTMKFVWPLLTTTLDERQAKISEGLQAAERGLLRIEEANEYATNKLRETKQKVAEILEEANIQAARILEDGKILAQKEHDNIVEAGRNQIVHELEQARLVLRGEIANLSIAAANKVLNREINPDDHRDLLSKVAQG